MTRAEIDKILELHKKWLDGKPDGVRADLSYTDLSDADLSGADLRGADLSGANLSDADLSGANLSGANLSYANLSGADLSDADLSGADLRGADLSGANLNGANLRGAKFDRTRTSYPVYSVSGIGSANRQTIYLPESDRIFCGCFTGTLKEFQNRIEETHKNNTKYLAQYRAVITYFETLKGIK